MPLKYDQIDRIGRSKATHKIFCFALSASEALKVEATLIDLINYIQPGQLTHEVSGHGVAEGLYTTAELKFALNASELITQEPVLFIKIERWWTAMVSGRRDPSTLTRAQTYEAIRDDWVLSLRRATAARSALAVARGLVRGVFCPDGWEEAGYENRKRMTGEGGTGGLDEFVGKSVAHLAATEVRIQFVT